MTFTLHYPETVVLIFALIGVVFMLISSIGVIRLPDVLSRMHAVGKAGTLGISAVLLSAGLFFHGHIWLMVALIALFFVTAPISTAAMARAAYRTRLHKREDLVYNDMADPRYETSEEMAKEQEQEQPVVNAEL